MITKDEALSISLKILDGTGFENSKPQANESIAFLVDAAITRAFAYNMYGDGVDKLRAYALKFQRQTIVCKPKTLEIV